MAAGPSFFGLPDWTGKPPASILTRRRMSPEVRKQTRVANGAVPSRHTRARLPARQRAAINAAYGRDLTLAQLAAQTDLDCVARIESSSHVGQQQRIGGIHGNSITASWQTSSSNCIIHPARNAS